MSESLSMAKAINLGLQRAMRENDKVLLMGEDIGTSVAFFA